MNYNPDCNKVLLSSSLSWALKFSDWTLSGRGIFLLVAPAALILILDDVFCTRKHPVFRAATWTLVSISLLLSHGMGRILVVAIVALVITDRCIRRMRTFKLQCRLHTHSQYPTGIAKLAVPVLASGLFLLPYIMYNFGNASLVGWWVLDRTEMTASLDTTSLGLLMAFLFIFVARLGVAAPLFILGVLAMPKLTPSDMPNITPFVLSIVLLFSLFLNSMYFYQALSVQMVIFAGLTACCTISKISAWLGRYTISGLGFPNPRVTKSIMTVSLLILCVSSTVFIQGTRFSLNEASVSNDILFLARYLEDRIANENISIFASSGVVARRFGAFVPSTPVFPMSDSLFFCHFPDQWSNIVYTTINATSDFAYYLGLLRYGLVIGKTEDLVNANKFSYNCSEEEFNMIQEKLNLKYLIHRETEDWPLLQMLMELRRVHIVRSSGKFHLYVIS